MDTHILTYGTLRKNAACNHNFQRFGPQELVGGLWLNGYNMFNLGSYPAAVAGVGQIFCEIHKVSRQTFDLLDRMERGAGYGVDYHVVDIDGADKLASLWVMPPEALEHFWHRKSTPRIMSGDWNEREEVR